MFEFTEDITIEVPNVKQHLDAFCESSFKENHKMIFEVAAIHEGLTANFNYYGKDQLEESLASWIEPYRKPIIRNHDPESDPIGRVMKARMDVEDDGSPFIRLQVAITNPEAVQRIVDERYLTGSVGGKAKSAVCSICNAEWAGIGMFGAPPCKHARGKVYSGKLAQFNLGGMSWKEYSFVNMPADQRSGIRVSTVGATESESDSIYAAHIYALDMDNESIVEFTESADPIDILSKMRKKEAAFTYMDIKGTWLSAGAIDYAEADKKDENGVNTHISNTITTEATSEVADSAKNNNSEEKNMPKVLEENKEEDVLSVLEELSDHLATSPEEDKGEKPEGQEDDDVKLPVNRESDDETDESVEDSTDEDQEDKEKDMTGDSAEGDDESEDNDSDESDSAGAEDESETDAGDDDSSEEELKDEDDKTDESDNTDEGADDESAKTIADLTTRVDALVSDNSKLKAMLHKILAERVVDRKIDLKMIKPEDRAEALEEHINRTAASLADSFKDLNKQVYVPSDEEKEEVLAELRKNYKKDESLDGGSAEDEEPINLTAVFEDRLVDALMGKRPL